MGGGKMGDWIGGWTRGRMKAERTFWSRGPRNVGFRDPGTPEVSLNPACPGPGGAKGFRQSSDGHLCGPRRSEIVCRGPKWTPEGPFVSEGPPQCPILAIKTNVLLIVLNFQFSALLVSLVVLLGPFGISLGHLWSQLGLVGVHLGLRLALD